MVVQDKKVSTQNGGGRGRGLGSWLKSVEVARTGTRSVKKDIKILKFLEERLAALAGNRIGISQEGLKKTIMMAKKKTSDMVTLDRSLHAPRKRRIRIPRTKAYGAQTV